MSNCKQKIYTNLKDAPAILLNGYLIGVDLLTFWCGVIDLLVRCYWPFGVVSLTFWWGVIDPLVWCYWPFGVVLLTFWCGVIDLLVRCFWPFGLVLLTFWCAVIDLLVWCYWLFVWFIDLLVWCYVMDLLVWCYWPFGVVLLTFWCDVIKQAAISLVLGSPEGTQSDYSCSNLAFGILCHNNDVTHNPQQVRKPNVLTCISHWD